MTGHTIATSIHGRYLVEVPVSAGPWPMLVGFHGYAERAEDMLDALRRIRGERAWLLVSVHALNRFYTKNQDVVANWMTREDRDLAIAVNIDYVAAVIDTVRKTHRVTDTIVYAGFSQGVAMAYRACAFAANRAPIPRAAGGIMLAGDVPPDVVPNLGSVPPVLIGRGTTDGWYTEAKAATDLEHFRHAGVTPSVFAFDGGHVWDASFLAAAHEFLRTREPVNP